MSIGIGVWAFVVYLAVVILWSTLVKRSMSESMLLGFLVVSLFGGVENYFTTLGSALYEAATEEILLATMLFVFMSAIMAKTGIIGELVEILNSLIGRLRGGSAYVSVLASALFGLVSGNSVANSATVSTITIPWMIESGWPKETAATICAGNAGSGQSFPASSAMFIMLGLPQVAALVTIDNFYFAMLTAGLWCVLYRLLIVRYYVSKYHVQAISGANIMSVSAALKKNWPSLLMFVSIAIPLIITISPLSKKLKALESFGPAGVKSISIVLWVPILMSVICIIEGWKRLPHTVSGWSNLLLGTQKSFASVGSIFLFAIAGSNVLSAVGFGDDLNVLLQSLSLPKAVLVLVVGSLVALVGGPLSGVATTIAMGPVAFAAMTGAGVSPVAAVAAFLIWMSTEGASPPSSSPIFVSCGLAGVDRVQVTFFPLVFHYVIPIVLIGAMIAMGILPIANT